MGFKCKFDNDERLQRLGAPKFIRCKPFDAMDYMQPFEVIGRMVDADEQKAYLQSCLDEDGGWVSFVCGHPEQVRLFAYQLMKHYGGTTNKLDWHHITGSRWDKYLDSIKPEPHKDMIVLDSMLTHPAMHPEGNRGYDPSRIGKIYDIVAKHRGSTSIVILCPGLKPDEAYHLSMVQFDMCFNLKYRAKEMEL